MYYWNNSHKSRKEVGTEKLPAMYLLGYYKDKDHYLLFHQCQFKVLTLDEMKQLVASLNTDKIELITIDNSNKFWCLHHNKRSSDNDKMFTRVNGRLSTVDFNPSIVDEFKVEKVLDNFTVNDINYGPAYIVMYTGQTKYEDHIDGEPDTYEYNRVWYYFPVNTIMCDAYTYDPNNDSLVGAYSRALNTLSILNNSQLITFAGIDRTHIIYKNGALLSCDKVFNGNSANYENFIGEMRLSVDLSCSFKRVVKDLDKEGVRVKEDWLYDNFFDLHILIEMDNWLTKGKYDDTEVKFIFKDPLLYVCFNYISPNSIGKVTPVIGYVVVDLKKRDVVEGGWYDFINIRKNFEGSVLFVVHPEKCSIKKIIELFDIFGKSEYLKYVKGSEKWFYQTAKYNSDKPFKAPICLN